MRSERSRKRRLWNTWLISRTSCANLNDPSTSFSPFNQHTEKQELFEDKDKQLQNCQARYTQVALIAESWCIWNECDFSSSWICMSSIFCKCPSFFPKLICTTEIIGIIGIHPNSPNSSTHGSQVMKALNEKRAKRDHLKEQALTTGFENN